MVVSFSIPWRCLGSSLLRDRQRRGEEQEGDTSCLASRWRVVDSVSTACPRHHLSTVIVTHRCHLGLEGTEEGFESRERDGELLT